MGNVRSKALYLLRLQNSGEDLNPQLQDYELNIPTTALEPSQKLHEEVRGSMVEHVPPKPQMLGSIPGIYMVLFVYAVLKYHGPTAEIVGH